MTRIERTRLQPLASSSRALVGTRRSTGRGPKNATQQVDSAERFLDEWEEEHQDRDEWITAALLEATADPLPRARWRPEGLLAQLDPIRNPYGLILPWDQ